MSYSLLRTAFFTALLSYVALLFLDYREPGFVSYVFSPHLVGFLAVVLGMFWYPAASQSSRMAKVLPLTLGILAAIVVWNEGTLFGDFRALLAIGVLVLPVLTVRILSRPA